jgi:hypothetical protein
MPGSSHRRAVIVIRTTNRPVKRCARRAVLLGAMIACAGPAATPRPDTSAASEPATTVPDAPWRMVAWHPHEAPVADRGRGVVALPVAEDTGAPGRASAATERSDTLVFRSRPDPAAPVAGLLLLRISGSGWEYAVAGPGLAAPNLVEFGYEESGVPIDSIVEDGQWLRGLLGTDSAGRWLTGWADARGDRIEHRWWADHLAGQALFALDTTRLRLAAEPGGAPIDIPAGEFILYGADSVRGRWLRARLVAPSDYCAAGDSGARHEQRLWVEYLDARGRPQVWYHSRGC